MSQSVTDLLPYLEQFSFAFGLTTGMLLGALVYLSWRR